MPRRTRFRPFRPYVTPRPPMGTYDPALDAQLGAAQRGFGDLRQDSALAGARADQDLAFGQEQIGAGFRRAEEDYGRDTALLRRQFDILAGQQQSQAAGQGVLRGGALLQSAAKRAANHALGQGQLDLGLARAREDRDVGLGRLGVDWQRALTDRTTGLSRAGREQTQFGIDIGAQRAFQAAGTGYAPPAPGEPGGAPRNEFTNRHGAQRRRIVRGGFEYVVAPDGTVVHSRRRRRP